MRWGRRPAPDEVADDRTNALVHAAAAQVLSYPDTDLLDRLDLIEEALAGTWAAELFAPVLAHLRGPSSSAGARPAEPVDAADAPPRTLVELQAFHVQEFDLSRRHALHLTYWTDGDTRRRGEVLAGIKQVYRDSGLVVDTGGELFDHLPMVCEFAVHDPARGLELLTRYRASLELLRLGCEDDHLPHAGVVEAVCRTLGGPRPRTRAEVQEMVKAIAPVETVGLDAYQPTYVGWPELQRN